MDYLEEKLELCIVLEGIEGVDRLVNETVDEFRVWLLIDSFHFDMCIYAEMWIYREFRHLTDNKINSKPLQWNSFKELPFHFNFKWMIS